MLKKCPFCAEEIQDDAIKCKHCLEFLDNSRPPRASEALPWYFQKSIIVFAVFCVGPLALPLIWFRPKTSPAWKLGLTVVILLLSAVMWQATVESYRMLKEYYNLLQGM